MESKYHEMRELIVGLGKIYGLKSQLQCEQCPLQKVWLRQSESLRLYIGDLIKLKSPDRFSLPWFAIGDLPDPKLIFPSARPQRLRKRSSAPPCDRRIFPSRLYCVRARSQVRYGPAGRCAEMGSYTSRAGVFRFCSVRSGCGFCH